ncbi:uncharacterized protein MONBRDRAFT_5429 [Monosiga brevicollis MX1]|uniref:Oxidoreductase n=1 Tax=Monosiga brevicollis TaxID=81824 RepID=A9UQY7_MONBE|nr:uncharacterized protein MONBRDRAFT_5429 [Monosiga brevicollis MX1]EDQ93127.1 predicted protein [Monosiga brevicollis MX1]|eukprot:XP_001742889.1 hypothetical protein [Monosiga brevicollis MX1]
MASTHVASLSGIRVARRARARAAQGLAPDELAVLASHAHTATAIPELQRLQQVATSLQLTGPDGSIGPEPKRVRRLQKAHHCYVCKQAYQVLHHFYEHLCTSCGDRNYAHRSTTRDLTGRIAVVTGGRLKIGFEVVVLLLRAGAEVYATTRFPRDAQRRFARLPDYDEIQSRLHLIGTADFSNLGAVQALAHHLSTSLPRLDILINNACQTITHDAHYMQLLHQRETMGGGSERPSLALADTVMKALTLPAASVASEAPSPSTKVVMLSNRPHQQALLEEQAAVTEPSLLQQLGAQVEGTATSALLNEHGEPCDLRACNTWTMPNEVVPTTEVLSTVTANYLAPRTLTLALLPLLRANPRHEAHIIQVSAMEGKYSAFKTGFHSHTNEAKAALNMLVRTMHAHEARHGVYMNSVDTGWVTNEYPLTQSATAVPNPPLDEVDGAARVLHPIMADLRGANGQPVHGMFFKDYKPTDW